MLARGEDEKDDVDDDWSRHGLDTALRPRLELRSSLDPGNFALTGESPFDSLA